MERGQFYAILVIIVVMGGMGSYLILTQPQDSYIVGMTITATENEEEVAWGHPETGFWGYENGAIDWKQMPYTRTYNSVNSLRVITYEFWFRERTFNGTYWEYFNHGPFFVDWPQLEYSRDIELNNHTIHIRIAVID